MKNNLLKRNFHFLALCSVEENVFPVEFYSVLYLVWEQTDVQLFCSVHVEKETLAMRTLTHELKFNNAFKKLSFILNLTKP